MKQWGLGGATGKGAPIFPQRELAGFGLVVLEWQRGTGRKETGSAGVEELGPAQGDPEEAN